MDLLAVTIPYALHLAALSLQPSIILQLDPLINAARVQLPPLLQEEPTRVIPYAILLPVSVCLFAVLITPFVFASMFCLLDGDMTGA